MSQQIFFTRRLTFGRGKSLRPLEESKLWSAPVEEKSADLHVFPGRHIEKNGEFCRFGFTILQSPSLLMNAASNVPSERPRR